MDASDTERLLRQTAWLRTLAGSLLRDPQDADDIVQDTWLAALRRPPHVDGGDDGLRGWLRRVAQNAARMRARGEARRRQREAAVARNEGQPGAAVSFERMSVQRALLDAVLALDDKDREVVVLRFFDHLAPRVIAQRTGSSSAAVRTRLSRALGRLRARLEREHGEDRWRGALLAVAFGGARRGLWWNLIMSGTTKALAGGLVAALAVLVWWGFEAQGPEQAGAAGTGGPDPAVAAAPAAGTGAAAGNAVPIERREVEPAAAAVPAKPKGRTLTALARCVDPAGTPVPGARIIAADVEGRPEALAGADGRARLDLSWPPKLTSGNPSGIVLEATAPGHNRVGRQQSADNAETVQFGDFELVPGGAVTGIVRGVDGAPAPAVYVQMIRPVGAADAATVELRRVSGRGFLGVDMALHTRTDAKGCYRIDGVPAGTFAVAAKARDGYWSHTGEVTVPAGGEASAPDLVIEPLEPANRIAGRVLSADGTPLVDASVEVFLNHGPRNVEAEAHGLARRPDARFEVAVLSGQRYTLQITDPRTPGRVLLQHDVEAGTEVTITFPLERTFTLLVTDAAGTPVDPSSVTGIGEDGRGIPLRPTRGGPGQYAVPAPIGTFRLQVAARGFRPVTLGPFAADALPERVTAMLQATPSICGRVVADGVGVVGAQVHLHRVPEDDGMLRFAGELQTRLEAPLPEATATTADGAFTIPVPAPGRYVVHAEVDGRAMAESGVFGLSGGRSVDGLELQSAAGTTLTGEVLAAPGVAVEGMLVAATRGDGHVSLQVVGKDGTFRFPGLMAGEWQVRRCEPDDQQWLRQGRTWEDREHHEFAVDVTVPATGEVHYRLDLTTEVPAVLRGRLTFGDAGASGWTVRLVQGNQHTDGRTDTLGRFEVRAREPGKALLLMTTQVAGGQLRLQRSFELSPGENSWEHTAALGGVTVTDLPPPAPPYEQMPLPGYALTWAAVEGVTWWFQFDPKDGGLQADGLPVGAVELRARQARSYRPPSGWEVRGSGRIAAGARTELAFTPR